MKARIKPFIDGQHIANRASLYLVICFFWGAAQMGCTRSEEESSTELPEVNIDVIATFNGIKALSFLYWSFENTHGRSPENVDELLKDSQLTTFANLCEEGISADKVCEIVLISDTDKDDPDSPFAIAHATGGFGFLLYRSGYVRWVGDDWEKYACKKGGR